MSIQIYNTIDDSRIVIANGDELLHINNLQSLIELREAINQYVLINDFITTKQARTMAKEQNINLHNNTILYACNAGKIEGAVKNGQWQFPRQSFLKWFKQHKTETRGK